MRPLVVLALSVALILGATSCGDSGTGGQSAESSAATTPTPSSQTSPTSGGSEGAEVSVIPIEGSPCDLLTPDEVAAATGLTVVSAAESSPDTCVYDLGDDAGVDIFIDVDRGEGGMFVPSAIFSSYEELLATGEAEKVPGLGGEALYTAGFRAIAVDDGRGHFIVIGVNGGYQALTEPADSLIQMAGDALARL
ncbi:MAG TPA: DUF3558 domain-containing protein [Acidimicrobiales bacterium]|nr:DUF3558 domain-containing protein [Acidimicrobiales bacterium]